MATYIWPATLQPSKVLWRQKHIVITSMSMFIGTAQTAILPGSRWEVSMEFPGQLASVRRAHEAFFLSIRQGADVILMPPLDRPAPLGTMRGVPTLASQMFLGSKSATIATTPGSTLKAGDFVAINTYLFMVRLDAVANASGLMDVEFVNQTKYAAPSGTVVLWDRPLTGFTMDTEFSGIARSLGGIAEPFAITLSENYGLSA